MENPVTVVKQSLNLNFFLKMLVGFILVNAFLELTGLDGWIYSPVSTFKGKFMSGS